MSSSTEAKYNDCWGYVQNNEEYAIAGSTEGVHFFKITEEDKLQHLDFVEGKYNSALVIHRDIKTYQHYAYAVCDEGESSLQIIDLSYLPDSVHVVTENDSLFGQVHNLFIDEDNGLMYVCTVTPFMNGSLQSPKSMQVYSLADPENPTLVYTGPNDIPEVHDAFVRNNIAYLNCGFDGLRVYDFSNPAVPIYLQNIHLYQDQGYNHQGWMTPNGQYYVFADETKGKQLKLCSIENNEVDIERRFGTNWQNESIPHNIMLTDRFAFVAYYNEGLRIYDITGIPVKEIAHFDTFPKETDYKLNGAWGVYSQLPSERILVSDRQNGLFLLKFPRDIFEKGSAPNPISLFPNHIESGQKLTLKTKDIGSFTIDIFSLAGKKVYTEQISHQTYVELSPRLAQGLYSVRIEYSNEFDEVLQEFRKLIVY